MGDLSENFDSSESRCRCGQCGLIRWPEYHVANMEALRTKVCEYMGKDWPVICTSSLGYNGGNRCPRQNRHAGGADDSRHQYCDAADIYVPGMDTQTLAKLAEQVEGFGGIGVGKNFIHVDSRPRQPNGSRARWTY